jgi:hypothetical protein
LTISFRVWDQESAAYFNNTAREGDIADARSNLDALRFVQAGQRAVGSWNWIGGVEVYVPSYLDQVDLIIYYPRLDHSPDYEKENMADIIPRAAAWCHVRGKRFMVIGDAFYTEQYITLFAHYADLVGLDGRVFQGNPEEFHSRMTEYIELARAENPGVLVFAQIEVSSAVEMYAAIETLEGNIDGVMVRRVKELGVLGEFVEMVR